jgi:hypothetical protein
MLLVDTRATRTIRRRLIDAIRVESVELDCCVHTATRPSNDD